MSGPPSTLPDATDSAALAEARRRRAALLDVLVGVEAALAAPAAGRVDDWAMHVHESLVELSGAFERHIAVTEGSDGLFGSVVERSPRLASGVEQLTDEHRKIRSAIGEAMDAVQRAADRPAKDPASGRDAVLALIQQLMRHRQRGADLVYEAYAVDIGEGD